MLNNKKPVMSAHRLPLLMLVMLVMFWSCDRTRTDKGYEYFPDMVHSQAYETYSENNVWEDGQTMRKPAEGTIPRSILMTNVREKSWKTRSPPISKSLTKANTFMTYSAPVVMATKAMATATCTPAGNMRSSPAR